MTANDMLPIAVTTTEAETITAAIKTKLEAIAENVDLVVPLIEKAKTDGVHEVLGFKSWAQYVTFHFNGVLARLNKYERQPIVELLSRTGMSTRAVAAVVGVSKDTVSRDLAGVSDETPAVTALVTTGLDGKKYVRDGRPTTAGVIAMTEAVPTARRRPRRPYAEDYNVAVFKLQKAIIDLERVHADERFSSYRESLEKDHWASISDVDERLDVIEADLAKRGCRDCGERLLPGPGWGDHQWKCEACR